jgi:hypothetical protein
MENTKTIVLEPSTNTHKMTNVVEVENVNESILKIKTGKNSQVIHGEHGPIGIESEHVIKYVQQELNPVTRKMQNAWD